ncbi:TetR/AcrR family transcriptional regulator [Lactiplantibacillus sp. WILCCON 0030]|uniref:TetR/AcrR family transcriptional regulator n=1 Tax=Lactiplantibacillus brownii TaxID=3069269 RepID=A0ABU1A7H9_9LACO|nr:TetR/AcrR family transcriptional regulator [Lactiplantibacillus brownii]MDQ7936884.1 TetR/AcrR family transcriptional regulator [Lactiplantibacillus brownii]
MKKKNEQRPQEIIDTVAKMIIDRGIVSITMPQVARRVGISQSNIYLYFHNKDDLLKQTFLTQKNLINNYLLAHFTDQPTVTAAMRLYARIIYQFALDEPIAIDVMIQYENSPIMKQVDISAEEATLDFDRITALVKHGMVTGEIRRTDPRVLLSIGYTTIINYVQAVNNRTIDPIQVPFDEILAMLEAMWKQPVNG